jgi:ribosomal protein S18 acetylase RimI-like enzyme
VGQIVVVRQAGQADVAAAAELWYASHLARRGGKRLSEEHHRSRVREQAVVPGALLMVAEEGDGEIPPGARCEGDGDPCPAGGSRVIGFILGIPGRENDGDGDRVPGLLHISLVAVAPDRWGEQVGRLMVEAILRDAAARGYRCAQLWTQADNPRANRLYRGLGFRRTGRVTLDGWGELIVQYQRELEDILAA